MKKITSFALLFLFMLIGSLNILYAANNTTTDLYDESQWNRVGDYMYYDDFPDKSELTSNQTFRFAVHSPFGTSIQYKAQGIYKDVNTLFDDYGINSNYLEESNKVYITITTNDNDVSYMTYMKHYGQFEEDFIEHTIVINNYDDLATNIRFYSFDIPNDVIYTEVADLPITESNRLGNVYFKAVANNLDVSISYNNSVYYLKYSFDINQDMTVFNTIEAYYMNINSEPQFIINHSDRAYLKDILEAPNEEKPAFVPHSIWDLNTDIIKTTNKYATHVHLKQNDEGVMMSYVYIDDYIIDNILSASVSWTSRQKNNWYTSLILGKYTEWETYVDTFTNDDYLEYKNLTSSWQDLIPYWNIARGIYKANKTYTMPRIEGIDINDIPADYNVTKIELESYFGSSNKDFNTFKDNPRYKLWAFALQGGKDYKGIKTEFYHNPDYSQDPRNFKVIEIIYETNKKVYQAVGNDMDLFITVNPPDDGILNETNATNWFAIIFITIIGLSVFQILSKANAFKSPKHLFRALFTLAIFLVILVVIIWAIVPDFLNLL